MKSKNTARARDSLSREDIEKEFVLSSMQEDIDPTFFTWFEIIFDIFITLRNTLFH